MSCSPAERGTLGCERLRSGASGTARSGRLDSPAGWLVVAAAALATFSAFGVVYSFGVVLDSIRSEFSIGTGLTSLLFASSTFIYFVLGLFTGRLGDRHGPSPVLLVGAASMGAGLWLTSLAQNLWLAMGTYGFGVGIAVACAYVPMVSAVGAWFERRRTAALGVAVAGIGLGQLVGAPAVEWLVGRYGWRDTYRVLSFVTAGLLLLAALAARRPPAAPAASEFPSILRLVRNRRFSLLYLSMFLLSASLFIPIVYIDNYVSDSGGTQGAWLISVIGLASVVGRLGLGALGGVLPLMRLYQISFAVMGLSYLIWLFAGGSYIALVVYTTVMGASYGGFIALSPAVATQLFGLAGLGGVLGALYTAAGFGGLVGPPLVGLLIDNVGYPAAIVVSMAVALASVPVLVAAARARSGPLATVGSVGRAGRASSPSVAAAQPGPPDSTSLPPSPSTSGSPPAVPVRSPLGPTSIDSVLLLSFGGPEGPEDVVPFLRNVTKGRDVPAERLALVEAQYLRHGGVSPINQQTRALSAEVSGELARRGITLTCYWGNRNWHPYLADTVRTMTDDGCAHAAVIVTSAFSSYSGCRQYNEDLAQAAVDVPAAPQLSRVRVYGNHPGFVGAAAQRVREAIHGARLGSDVHTLFTAHSLPSQMAASCDYEAQLHDAAVTVAEMAGLAGGFEVVYQSRSGPPHVPWLAPDVSDRVRELGARGCRAVLVVPLGFVSDHMEVLVDLDTKTRAAAARAGMTMVRARTVGTHPLFVEALADLIEETAGLRSTRPTTGCLGPRPDVCAPGCCAIG
ncbi:ferrochelatase [Candidatus Poriferisodalis sp.]|uniref:ferrochelatase n=1 Tax=Candidatus Poriferisodalis sp. TaxID=3101277 RepID=UPI003B013761